jgi:hypothetical protein
MSGHKARVHLNEQDNADILWGAEAIAQYVGLDLRRTYYLLAKGALPSKKLGARTIVARKSELRAALSALPGGYADV